MKNNDEMFEKCTLGNRNASIYEVASMLKSIG